MHSKLNAFLFSLGVVVILGLVAYAVINPPQIANTFNEAPVTRYNALKQKDGALIVETVDHEAVFSRVSLSGQKTRLFSVPADPGFLFHATLLSDKRTVVYADGNVRSYDLKTGTIRTIKEQVGTENDPASYMRFASVSASPDNSKLLLNWIGWEGGGMAIMNIDGSNLIRLDNRWNGDTDWSADSKQFVIASQSGDMGGIPASLYIASTADPAHGKDILPIDNTKAYPDAAKDVYAARFSPDGTKIAFGYRYMDYGDTYATGGVAGYYRGIYTVNADGSNFAQVSKNESFSTHPLWKNNNTLYYGLNTFYTGSDWGIYSIDLPGQNNQVVHQVDEANRYEPLSLSTDGRYMIFKAGFSTKDTWLQDELNMFLLDLQTNQSTQLTKATPATFVGWLK